MNTAVYTQTRRKSITAYNAIINSRNEHQMRKTIALEQQKGGKITDTQAVSQSKINALCNNIQSNYASMVKDGKDMKQYQGELDEKLKEEELFYSTADEIYSYNDVDETVLRKMNLRRFAYYTLPVLDCFFAYFALYPIITSKIADLSESLAGFAVIIGAVISIVVGLGVSLISRLGVASLEDNDSLISMRKFKLMVIGGSVISLPLMYIIGEVSFNGGTQWTYSGCFAFISLIIQLLMVSGYKSQVEALDYFRNRKQAEEVKNIKEADENAIRSEIQSIRDKIQCIISSFNQEYICFTERFRNLVIAQDEHIKEYGFDADYYLDPMVIYLGNLICFHQEAIPIYSKVNGVVVVIPFGDFPYAARSHNIFLNNDFQYLDYIMQRAHSDASLSETLRIFKEHNKRSVNLHTSVENEHTENDLPNQISSKEDYVNDNLNEEAEEDVVYTNLNRPIAIHEEKSDINEVQQQIKKNVFSPEQEKKEQTEYTPQPDNKGINVKRGDSLPIKSNLVVPIKQNSVSSFHTWLKNIYDTLRQMLEEE